MATKNINEDMTTTLIVDSSNDTYILGKQASIKTDGEAAIDVLEGTNNNNIVLKGKIEAANTDHAIHIEGNRTHLAIAKGAGVMTADMGVFAEASNFSLDNDGYIFGDVYGVWADQYSEVVNSGSIAGAVGGVVSAGSIALTNSGKIHGGSFGVAETAADGAIIRNLADGRITSGDIGIMLTGDGTSLIKNSGLISGPTAIQDGIGDATVINKGKISGDVFLGFGADVFNTSKGELEGTVNGGAGDDTYVVGDKNIQIVEAADFGLDKVKSTVTFTLGENIEDLVLLGSNDTKGTGNGDDNTITGNKGDNVLSGLDGDDYLIGGKGKDVFIGGAGEDVFDFRKGTGDDVVNDFVDGEDVIYTPFAADEADLLANHLIQKNGGVLVSYGDDSLFIKGVTLAELDENDFFTI